MPWERGTKNEDSSHDQFPLLIGLNVWRIFRIAASSNGLALREHAILAWSKYFEFLGIRLTWGGCWRSTWRIWLRAECCFLQSKRTRIERNHYYCRFLFFVKLGRDIVAVLGISVPHTFLDPSVNSSSVWYGSIGILCGAKKPIRSQH